MPTPPSPSCNRAASWCARWRGTGCRNICGSRSAPARRWKRSRRFSLNSWAVMNNPLFERVALIGIGLIGSSLARVLRRDCPQTRIVACARRAETPQAASGAGAPRAEPLEAARRLGIADETTDDAAAAVRDADLVVLATPLSAYEGVASRISPALRDGAIVTDVGSVKGTAIEALLPTLPDRVHFVPGHPVAGTE